MKIVVIGDIHGRTMWKDVVEQNEDYDKLIFIGDYFDTFEDISIQEQYDNFKEILELKEENKDKVVLLTGNHDQHYIGNLASPCSGYTRSKHRKFSPLLNKAHSERLIQMAHVEGSFLFTHAGVSKTWMVNNDLEDIPEEINELFYNHYFDFDFRDQGRSTSPYGDNVWQSPIWIRPKSLAEDAVDDYNQVVGHTRQEDIARAKSENGNDLIFIDALGAPRKYLTIEDGIVHNRTVE